MKNLLTKLLSFIANCTKLLWLYFPVILFCILAAAAFIGLSQGQDVLLIAVWSKTEASLLVLAVTFFAFINWYTSRLIAYAKDTKNPGDIPHNWLQAFPRVIGYLSFTIIQFGIINNPYFASNNKNLWMILLIATQAIVYYVIKRIFKNKNTVNKYSAWLIVPIILIASLVCVLFCRQGNAYIFSNFKLELFCLWGVQTGFLVWNFVRRVQINEHSTEMKALKMPKMGFKIIDLPNSEEKFFWWFNAFALIPLVFYVACILWLSIAQRYGAFDIVMLSFGVVVGFLQLVTLITIYNRVNFHFIFWILAILIGKLGGDPYQLRTFEEQKPVFETRPTLAQYTEKWLDERMADISDSPLAEYPLYFVLSDGGASRSGYWVATALGKLENETDNKFSRHLFCLSGASGGSVGNGTFYALLDSAYRDTLNNSLLNADLRNASKEFLRNDFLSFTLSHMLGADFFRHVFPFFPIEDRSRALEQSMEGPDNNSFVGALFGKRFSEYTATLNPAKQPILFINTTRVADGAPGVISNIKVEKSFTPRIDVLSLLDGKDTVNPDKSIKPKNINFSTAVCLGARFPYISPAADINGYYFVDGGYFDNSGAGIVMEAMAYVDVFIRNNPKYASLRSKLRFYVVHMSNSEGAPEQPGHMHPLVNDLLTPVLTLAGTFSKQTNVNNTRLKAFVDGYINKKDTTRNWTPINLYNTTDTADTAPFSMNWVISDTTLIRMDRRLNNNFELNNLASDIRRLKN